eukprot:GHUV01039995.1.p2 GENE.GHUV01039995.1~~GHUV01039995.1.p2  ORF type:complete len:110 (+),score=1.22 GHUV01039995.1:970-1299(+)
MGLQFNKLVASAYHVLGHLCTGVDGAASVHNRSKNFVIVSEHVQSIHAMPANSGSGSGASYCNVLTMKVQLLVMCCLQWKCLTHIKSRFGSLALGMLPCCMQCTVLSTH